MENELKINDQERDLLLKDLCARLPYGVICEDEYGNVLELNGIDKPNFVTFKCSDNTFWTTDLDKCKPYLFPLSSMTEEQRKELWELHFDYISDEIFIDTEFVYHEDYVHLIDWLNKNHFDWRGLIPMGLANDATGLNIY